MGSIFIELDQPYYFAGDTVTGHINISLNKEIDGAKITLKLKGWESVYWITQQIVHDTPENPFRPPRDELLDKSDCEVSSSSTDSSDAKEKSKKGYIKKGQQYYKITHHTGGKEFMKLKQKMNQFKDENLHAGQHRIPFSFSLSNKWPGTFTYKTKDCKARIKYEMRVKCKLNEKKEREFEHKAEVIVHEKPNQALKSQEQTMVGKVTTCCCISKGESKITLGFQKDQYAIGEEATLFCDVDNSGSSAKINSIVGSLNNRINLISKAGTQKLVSYNVSSINFGQCEPGETHMGDKRLVKNLQIDNKKAGTFKKCINPTSTGKFISSVYFIAAESNMDTCCSCCGSDPRVSIPVLVIPPSFQPPVFQPPSDWHPKQYEVMNIALPPEQLQDANQYNPMDPYGGMGGGNMNQIQPM